MVRAQTVRDLGFEIYWAQSNYERMESYDTDAPTAHHMGVGLNVGS